MVWVCGLPREEEANFQHMKCSVFLPPCVHRLRSNYLSHNHFRDPRPSRINVYPSSFRFYPLFSSLECLHTNHLFLYSKYVYAHPNPLCFTTYLIVIVHSSCLPSTHRSHSSPRSLSFSCYPCHIDRFPRVPSRYIITYRHNSLYLLELQQHGHDIVHVQILLCVIRVRSS